MATHDEIRARYAAIRETLPEHCHDSVRTMERVELAEGAFFAPYSVDAGSGTLTPLLYEQHSTEQVTYSGPEGATLVAHNPRRRRVLIVARDEARIREQFPSAAAVKSMSGTALVGLANYLFRCEKLDKLDVQGGL